MSENTVILTPAGVKAALENAIRLSRDLKTTMNKTGTTLHIEIDATGSVAKLSLNDLQGKIVANAAQLAGIGGVRRFVLDATKEAERESADHGKISVAKNMKNQEKIKLVKVKPDANGRVSELIRMAGNTGENRMIADQWDDEGIEGITKRYVIGCIDEILVLIKDETKHVLERGKTDEEFLEKELKDRLILKWMYKKVTTKNGITVNMQEGIDFLFPKNSYQNGVTVLLKEALNGPMMEKHWLLTSGNEGLMYTVDEYMNDMPEPAGKDAKRLANNYKENIEILLKPKMKPIDMIERYRDAKYKPLEQKSLPDGEAGYILRKKIPGLTVINTAWNEFFRFTMFREIDAESFWSQIVDTATYKNWDLTAQQNVKYWVNELSESEIQLNDSWEMSVYDYILSRIGIYSPKEKEGFLNKYAIRKYVSCAERHAEVERLKTEALESEKIIKEWTERYNRLPDKTDDEKRAKQIELGNKPEVVVPLNFEEIVPWDVAKKTGEIPFYKKKVEIDALFDHVFVADISSVETIFNLDSKKKVTVTTEEEKEYLRYFKSISAMDTQISGSIGIADSLTEQSKTLLEQLKSNEKYGKKLKPKITNWLVTTFAGAKELQSIATEAILLSLQNQDFYNEKESEDI